MLLSSKWLFHPDDHHMNFLSLSVHLCVCLSLRTNKNKNKMESFGCRKGGVGGLNFSCHGRYIWRDLEGARGTRKSSPQGPARGGRPLGGPGRPLGANFTEGRRPDAPKHARRARRTARGSVGVFARCGVPFLMLIRETWGQIEFSADEGAPRLGMPCVASPGKCIFTATDAAWGRVPRQFSRASVPRIRWRRKIGRLASEAVRRTT